MNVDLAFHELVRIIRKFHKEHLPSAPKKTKKKFCVVM
jgi:hypothetical protein